MNASLKLFCFSLLLISCFNVFGQKSFAHFAQFYPMGEDPGLRFMSSYTPQETIMFEANPFVNYSFYNDFSHGLLQADRKQLQAWYIAFRPTVRVYTDMALPLRTPSLKFYVGTQHLFRINHSNSQIHKYWGFSFESGHYSNGQSGSSFSEKYNDGTYGDSIYLLINDATDLSEMLNRKNGNYSVNLTEVVLNYRAYKMDTANVPRRMHSISLGYVLYHRHFFGVLDMGGITKNDAAIIGRHTMSVNFEYMKVLERFAERRFSLKQHVEYIYKTHPFINPFRMESSCTFYPFQNAKEIGLVLSYIYGHDNYNYRVVDSGHQMTLGITWSQFPPFTMNGNH